MLAKRFLHFFILVMSAAVAFGQSQQDGTDSGNSLTASSATSQAVTVTRDATAQELLSASISAMGGTAAKDVSASGTITVQIGDDTKIGSIRVGARQTGDFIQQNQFSDGASGRSALGQRGREKTDGTSKTVSLESRLTAEADCLPLLVIEAALNNKDVAIEYEGLETIDGRQTHHLRYWNTFASNPKAQRLARLTTRDIWIDDLTHLPVKLAYEQRSSTGASPGVPISVTYEDFKPEANLLLPHTVRQSYNGTPWATITLNSFAVNAGISDSELALQ